MKNPHDSVSRLAAAIAHDFGNLFEVIESQAHSLLARPGLNEVEADAVRRIASAAQRARDLSAQLQGFGKRGPASHLRHDLNELVLETVEKVERLLPGGVELIFEPNTESPHVACDAAMVGQALIELIQNASEATVPANGQVRVSTGLAEIEAAVAEQNPNGRAGRFASVSVSDKGRGMDETTLARVFKPFFTTKKAAKRAGLGLSKANAIVQLHGGWIQVSSQCGQGSVFTVYLPTQEDEAAA